MGMNFTGKIWGAHIIPTPTQVAFGSSAWTHMNLDWKNNVAGSNFTDWIKPQVDAAVSAGANCIGIFGCPDGVHAATITQAAVNANFVQLANYLQGLVPPVAFYPKLCAFNQMAGIGNAEASTYMLSVLGAINGLVTVVGVDLLGEANSCDRAGDGIRSQANADLCNGLYTLVKAGTSLPLTFSSSDEWNGGTGRAWIAKIDASCDYIDFHPYSFNGWATPINTADTAYWFSTYPGKDLYFGEGGSLQSDSITQQNAYCNGLGYLMYQSNSNLRGWCYWAIADQDTVTSNMFGMYDNTFVARYNKVQTFKWYAAARPSRAHIGIGP